MVSFTLSVFSPPSHTYTHTLHYAFEQQSKRMSFNYKISPQLVVLLKHRETERKKKKYFATHSKHKIQFKSE